MQLQRAKKLTFSRRLFNPNFYHLRQEMQDLSRRFIWCYGGSSSAKSYSIVQAILIQGCLIEKSNTLVFRKVSATISKTIKKDFDNVIKSMGMEAYFKILDREIRCYNGSIIDFSGMDDSEKIKGISSYKRVFLEEVSEFDHSDFKQVRKRLRGREGQQIICAFNPIDEDHWIKKKIFDPQEKEGSKLKPYLDTSQMAALGSMLADCGIEYSTVTEKWQGGNIKVKGKEYPPNFVVMKSTYLNNFWVVGSPCKTFGFDDIQTQADFEADRKADFDFYNIYALGNWGKLNKGGEMYKHFHTAKHIGETKYNPERGLHLTFDENVNPYMTLDIWQGEDLRVEQIDEICLEDPKNTLPDTMREFRSRYPNNGTTIFVYGDATSKKADAKLEKGRNFFTIVENELTKYGYTVKNRVRRSNPNVESRCNWINEIFRVGLDDIEILIDENCTKTISDYKYLKQASDGGKFKEKAKDPDTKITYEKYGHNTDANEYFLCQYFESSFVKFTRPRGSSKASRGRRGVKKGY